MDRDKVVVVDDDGDVRRTITVVLEPICSVLGASGGPEALELLRREHPTLVLLDMAMPGMDGLAVLREIRSLESSVAVVMLTGEKEIEIAERALSLGAAAYITKPFDVDYLRAEVQRLLASRRSGSGDATGRPWRVEPGSAPK